MTLSTCTLIKYVVASVVCIFYIGIILIGIGEGNNIANFGGPAVEYPLLFAVLILLTYNEGFQVGVLRSEHLDANDIEQEGYPRAARIHRLMFSNGSQLKRLLIGQSFFVVLSTFLIAQLTTFDTWPAVAGVSPWFMDIFIRSGLPGVFVTICCAQLLPSMLAKEYPLQALNVPGVYSVIYAALAVETIGIVQFTYLSVAFVKSVWIRQTAPPAGHTHKPLPGGDVEERAMLNGSQTVPDWVTKSLGDSSPSKAITSTAKAAAPVPAIVYVYYALDMLKYTLSTAMALMCLMWVLFCIGSGYSSSSGPIIAHYFLVVLALIVVFYCEGLKVAVVGTCYLEKDDPSLLASPAAASIHALLNEQPEGVQRFLLGRQLIVVPLNFLVAQITNFSLFPASYIGSNLGYFLLVSLGLPGMLLLLMLSQLTPQLVAESDGLAFMSKKGNYSVAYVALCIEKLGLTSFAWVLFALVEKLACQSQGFNMKGAKEEAEAEVAAVDNEGGSVHFSNPLRKSFMHIYQEQEQDENDV